MEGWSEEKAAAEQNSHSRRFQQQQDSRVSLFLVKTPAWLLVFWLSFYIYMFIYTYKRHLGAAVSGTEPGTGVVQHVNIFIRSSSQ